MTSSVSRTDCERAICAMVVMSRVCRMRRTEVATTYVLIRSTPFSAQPVRSLQCNEFRYSRGQPAENAPMLRSIESGIIGFQLLVHLSCI